MNKDDIVASLAKSANISKIAAERGLNGLLSTITEAIEDGDRVNLVGFGSFSLIDRAPRLGRNPKTGEAVTIPSRRSIKFNPGKKLIQKIRQ
jgi:DNA-binding protein HU-beta